MIIFQVAPVAASEAQLLAPQEIMGAQREKARGELIGAEERTETDRKRERRRKKKAKQGAIFRSAYKSLQVLERVCFASASINNTG